jgi:hypothetical protein
MGPAVLHINYHHFSFTDIAMSFIFALFIGIEEDFFSRGLSMVDLKVMESGLRRSSRRFTSDYCILGTSSGVDSQPEIGSLCESGTLNSNTCPHDCPKKTRRF